MLGIPVVRLAVVGVGAVAVLYLLNGKGSATTPAAQCQYQVTADVLNVRAGPATTNRIVDQLRDGAQVTADRAAQTGFRRIDDTHWVSADYLRPGAGC